MIAQIEREVKLGCPLWCGGLMLGELLSPGLELDVLDGDAVEGMETNEPAGSLLVMSPASHRQRSARYRQGLEGTALRAANPAYEQAQERAQVGLLILTFAQSPEPGISPAPKTPPPGLDSRQVVEHPPPEDAPEGRLGHWQG